jgi:mono/diheme cytochrome c family protein
MNVRKIHAWCAITAIACAAVSGCKRDDMAEQPRMRTYEPAKMFIDGTEARPLVAGVVARAPANTPGSPYAYQWESGPAGTTESAPDKSWIPFPIDPMMIDRGRERYNIYCAVCHGRLGDGNGMIVQRGFIRPASFHNDRLSTQVADSHFYNTMSNGRGAMFSYAERVAPHDRWAIVAYIRALQISVKEAVKNGAISKEDYVALQGTHP